MNRSFLRPITAVGLAVMAVALLACSSTTTTSTPTAAPKTGTAAPTATATATTTATATATTTAAASATTIKTAQVGTATALVEAKGLTLYVFKNDTAGSGKSACNGGCATTWPPVTVTTAPTKATGIGGDLGTITREDGTTQVTYKGMPLYRFAADAAAGDSKGAAINNWAVATP